ncbi:branched-chain amino acid aminotransferase [Isoptericola sp. b441]|uniref:branched-chain-amino-acid transaminase n=1 Tax=Actinotalea lenta TaxID=3064654 RepID=A0ABT9DBF2_9CELL|nr:MULTISPECIES: branched-chain amino acid aminotransferase [unclassified Isoptericola]MDO8108217.1 branched-chain amino acid aminotransferase [Isoptericola sp. b441]MDO8120111.1 branched-chain amino acid aminotransferase [Isoptericola sp. b490]
MTSSSGALPPVPEFALHPNPHPVPPDARAAALEAPRFGAVVTDHMARMTWTSEDGWLDRRVEPYAPLALEPAALVLHYGQEIFEGLKAYRHPDGSVWGFRPEANAARFAASARRMALPELPVEDFLASVRALVTVDQAWVPPADDASLYLRPVMFASEPNLLVRAARRVEYVVIASPAGAYFAGGAAPVSIWVAQDLHRASPGGTGAVKTMGNYGASLASQAEAYRHGCEQVCFLDAVSGRNLEELGGMNLVAVRADGTVLTPALDGAILPGITRDAVLRLLAADGHEVVERALPLEEVLAGLASGEVTELFACGTGAGVSPIGRLVGHGFDARVADGGVGPVTARVRAQLMDIQHGRAPDERGWMVRWV